MGPVSWTDGMDETFERALVEAGAVDDVCRYFKFGHLPAGALRDTSRLFAYLAHEVLQRCPRCPQRTHALNHLLLAKDAAVRSCVPA